MKIKKSVLEKKKKAFYERYQGDPGINLLRTKRSRTGEEGERKCITAVDLDVHLPPRKSEKKKEDVRKHCSLLPDDILIQILSRIPGRSLMRFRLVCNLFCSSTLDPTFVDLHMKHARINRPTSTTPSLILFSQPNTDGDARITLLDQTMNASPSSSFTVPSGGRRLFATPSCNGLVCIHDSNNDPVRILNLTTREIISLPRATDSKEMYGASMCHLLFHPSTKEYKVVRFFSPKGYDHACEVLTLGTRSWKKICHMEHLWPYMPGRLVVSIDGVMYRLVISSKSSGKSIESFDPVEENFRLIPLPARGTSYQLVESEGSLGCVVHPSDYFNGQMYVWVLKDITNHVWICKHRFLIEGIPQAIQPIFFSKDKIFLLAYAELYCADLLGKNGCRLSEVYQESRDPCIRSANVYEGSLVSLGAWSAD